MSIKVRKNEITALTLRQSTAQKHFSDFLKNKEKDVFTNGWGHCCFVHLPTKVI